MSKPDRDTNSVDSSNALLDIARKDVDGVLKLFDTTLEGLIVPFFQSRASLPMLLITATVMCVGMYTLDG